MAWSPIGTRPRAIPIRGIGDIVVDVGPYKLHAKGYNRPVRAQTGWNWDGRNDCFRLAPQEYGGIEFHSDAMIDCNWKVTELTEVAGRCCEAAAMPCACVPATARGLGEEYIVFFVRPKMPNGAYRFPRARPRAISPMRTSI